MSPGRWFAAGPNLSALSASVTSWADVLALGEARARFYGRAEVFAVAAGRVEPVLELELDDGGAVRHSSYRPSPETTQRVQVQRGISDGG